MSDQRIVFGGLTIGRAQREAAKQFKRSKSSMLDARILMKTVLGVDDAYLIVHENRILTIDEAASFDALVQRRLSSEPIAHIVGEREFWGLPIKVDPGVLVPRADSETLISVAVSLRGKEGPYRILDLGTGSGCLLCAMLSSFPNASGVAVDQNEDAARLARKNLMALGFEGRATVFVGKWMTALSGEFDIVISNPPYIPFGDAGQLSDEVAHFEDPQALFAEENGMADYKEIFDGVERLLAPNGLVIAEIGDGQAQSLELIARDAIQESCIGIENDLNGRPRAIFLDSGARKPKEKD